MTVRAVLLGLLGAVFVAATGCFNDQVMLLTPRVGKAPTEACREAEERVAASPTAPVILPEGVAASAAAKPPSPLALSLDRAFRWQEMIESGQAESNSDLARKLKLDQSYVARTIRLASLAPDIVEAVLDGREPAECGLNALRRDLPLAWEEQRELLGLSSHQA